MATGPGQKNCCFCSPGTSRLFVLSLQMFCSFSAASSLFLVCVSLLFAATSSKMIIFCCVVILSSKAGKYEEKLINSNSIVFRPEISFERLQKFNKGKWFAVLVKTLLRDEWWINLTSRFKRHEKCNATLIAGEGKLVFLSRKFDFTSSYIGWRNFLITPSSWNGTTFKNTLRTVNVHLWLDDEGEDGFWWISMIGLAWASSRDKGLIIRWFQHVKDNWKPGISIMFIPSCLMVIEWILLFQFEASFKNIWLHAKCWVKKETNFLTKLNPNKLSSFVLPCLAILTFTSLLAG